METLLKKTTDLIHSYFFYLTITAHYYTDCALFPKIAHLFLDIVLQLQLLGLQSFMRKMQYHFIL